jgi:nucleoside-diphosphate-sugar epimerase
MARRNVLVTGGCGFLGNRMAEMLRDDGCNVTVLDLIDGDLDSVRYVRANLCKRDELDAVCAGQDEIYHVASLTELFGARERFLAINVEGTRNLLQAAAANGVKTFVYTSSASVVFAGNDIENGDESLPYPGQFLDNYTESKALAEQVVLDFDGTDGVRTVAIRPHSIYGPRDRHFWPKVIASAAAGKLRWRLGSGENLSDYTFVDNCAHAHMLAAKRLASAEGRAVVGGQAYFVSDGEPSNFWGTMKQIAVGVGFDGSDIGTRAIPFAAAYAIGAALEKGYAVAQCLCRVRSGPTLTRFVAANACTSHYFSIAKAQRDLGYTPLRSHDDAMQLTIAYYRGLNKHRFERDQSPKND